MRMLCSYLFVALGFLGSAVPAAAQDCASPDAPARVIRPVAPDVPVLALQQGIQGRVEVVVSLDAQSRVVAAKVRSSPSAILNHSAVDAARNSTYRTRIVNCTPVAADYVFSVTYTQR